MEFLTVFAATFGAFTALLLWALLTVWLRSKLDDHGGWFYCVAFCANGITMVSLLVAGIVCAP